MRGKREAKKFPVEVLKSRVCNAVGIVVHKRKYSINDATQKDPLVEDIKNIRAPDERKCIEKTVSTVIEKGEKTGTLGALAETFFWKGNRNDDSEIPFLENGKEIAELFMSIEKTENKKRFATYLLEILVDTAEVKAIEKTVETFDSIRKISEQAAFTFLYRSVVVASKEAHEVINFAELMGLNPVISSLKSCNKRGEDFGMMSLKSSTNVAYFTKNGDAMRDAALATLVVCGTGSDSSLHKFLSGMAMVANVTKSAESVKHTSEISYRLSNKGENEELESFFSYIEKLVKDTKDPAEIIIGVVAYCRQTAEGRDMTRFTNPPDPEEKKTPAIVEEDDEYPEFTEIEGAGISTVERIEIEFRDLLDDKFADAFLERMEFVEKDKEAEMCGQYAKILNSIKSAAEELGEESRTEYLWMAEEMLKNMNNGFLFAPLAYRVLGEIVRKDSKKAEDFVWKTIEAGTNENLADICRNG